LIGNKTFVGYSKEMNDDKLQLPSIKSGILSPTDIKKNKDNPLTKTNLLYAKNYTFLMDLEIIYSNWKQLDRN
jgi:lipopolysaccharide/colanic/teichoic acid biosynthesis glycosyltransferase